MNYFAVYTRKSNNEYLTSNFFSEQLYKNLEEVKKDIDRTTRQMFGKNAKTIYYRYGGKMKKYKPPYVHVIVKVYEVTDGRREETSPVATKFWTGKRYQWR